MIKLTSNPRRISKIKNIALFALGSSAGSTGGLTLGVLMDTIFRTNSASLIIPTLIGGGLGLVWSYQVQKTNTNHR